MTETSSPLHQPKARQATSKVGSNMLTVSRIAVPPAVRMRPTAAMSARRDACRRRETKLVRYAEGCSTCPSAYIRNWGLARCRRMISSSRRLPVSSRGRRVSSSMCPRASAVPRAAGPSQPRAFSIAVTSRWSMGALS
ncbi:MAG: hypothetical protein AUG49_20350 [Catenulispora sp. 13_1_20CM_3_70_7]|nr:MAG: hypothetical protein AUG49_20350 [Catenulispora sp. 13_1_20CM_3_70_7]